MKVSAVLLALFLSAIPVRAHAEELAVCRAEAAGLEWVSCEGSTDASWRRLAVRTCFGDDLLGTFTGQLKILVTADHGGHSQIGSENPVLLVAAKGCFEDWVGGNRLLEGRIDWLVEGRGIGAYSVEVLVFDECCPD